jgi:hypothetical protein
VLFLRTRLVCELFSPQSVINDHLKGTTECARCQTGAADGVVVKGQIPLTAALVQHFGQDKLTNLTPDIVNPYLQRELHWRVQLVRNLDPNPPFSIQALFPYHTPI